MVRLAKEKVKKNSLKNNRYESQTKALYALMEDHGYSHACITATIMLLRDDRYALDEMILFIEDEKPSEDDIIEKTADLLQK